tara:strand:- start:2199 stop:2759 length:561 start_codon:yes stop_codon:yes gene_type:complete
LNFAPQKRAAPRKALRPAVDFSAMRQMPRLHLSVWQPVSCIVHLPGNTCHAQKSADCRTRKKFRAADANKWMKGNSMYKTGTMILAVAMTAMTFSAAPAFAQDRERTSVAAPEYPRGAQRRGVEGYAVVEYTISPDGVVENPTVVEAEPAGVFDRAVLHAIEAWSYAPAAVSSEGLTQRFDFNLGE